MTDLKTAIINDIIAEHGQDKALSTRSSKRIAQADAKRYATTHALMAAQLKGKADGRS